MNTSSQGENPLKVTLASFWLRLAAWTYDLLGAVAVFILALLSGMILVYLIALPFGVEGETLARQLSHQPLWWLYLAASVQYYYVWCWVKGGQTVGMRTWRLKLCHADGQLLSWKEAYIRSFLSLGGVANLWSLFDPQKRGWHDLYRQSLVVVLPKGYNKPTQPLI